MLRRLSLTDASSRLTGLKLPKYNVDEEDLSEYGKRLGLKGGWMETVGMARLVWLTRTLADKKQTSIREDLNSIAKNAAQNSEAPSSQ